MTTDFLETLGKDVLVACMSLQTDLEPQKVRDCVLPTLVGRTGLEPVTP